MVALRIEIDTPDGLKTFRVVRKRSRGNWGTVDHEKKIIEVDPSLTGIEFLSTLIHECTHAAAPDLSEEAVIRIERSLANAIRPVIARVVKETDAKRL